MDECVPEDVKFWVGIDWATETHALRVNDGEGRKVKVFTFKHTRDGFEELTGRLGRLDDASERVVIGIERPDGRLVDRLLEAGHPVVAVSPNAIKAWREAEVTSGAKNDDSDANVIAEYLRLCRHRLRVLTPYSDQTRALRAAERSRTDLVKARVTAANQLEACLDAFWPGAKGVFCDVTVKIALAFLERYPTPADAKTLGEKRMAAFCNKHGYSGGRSPAELLARLRNAPEGITDGLETQARRECVLGYVRVLRALIESIKVLDRQIDVLLKEHPDGKVFMSFPRAGRINAAQVLGESGDCRDAYDGPDAVAALAGVTPVTKQSGKHIAVHFRWACNKRLRNAITTFADNSRHASPWAADIYDRARDRGHEHTHAVRILARAWIRVMWRCWIDQTPYNVHMHAGAAQFLAETSIEILTRSEKDTHLV